MDSNIIQVFTLFMKAIFPGQTPVPPRLGTWILDLSHDPIWGIWLAEVRKFHQHHDRIECHCLSCNYGQIPTYFVILDNNNNDDDDDNNNDNNDDDNNYK